MTSHFIPSEEMSSNAPKESLDTLAVLKNYGYNTHSFLSLYPGVSYFHMPDIEGYIPYAMSKNMILAAGDPVGPDENIPILVKAFLAHFKSQKKYVGFVPVSQKMTPILQELGFDKMHIGREPIFNLKQLPKPSRSIRQAIRRAIRKGMKVISYDSRYEESIQTLCQQWQGTREIPAMDFLFQLRPLACREHKKYFLLVDQDEKLLAMLACSPIYNRNGWYLEDFIRDPNTPNGGSELLIETAMEMLSQEGYEMATLAIAPLAGLPEKNDSHPIGNELLKLVYRRLSFVYHFQTLEFFKGKFGPSHWEDNSFCFYPHGLSAGLGFALVDAFLPGGVPAIVIHKLKQWRPLETIRILAQRDSGKEKKKA